MPVTGLDHVTIVAADLEASARFYADVLGLERRNGPSLRDPSALQWMHDPSGRAIVHLITSGGDDPRPGSGASGGFDHVALACHDYEATVARLEERGLAYRTIAIAELRLRQVILHDPDGVKLELTFRE